MPHHAYGLHGRTAANTNMTGDGVGLWAGAPYSRPFFGRRSLRVFGSKGGGVVRRVPSSTPRPSGLPGQQLKIPTPRELERMRQFRQQHHLRQQLLHRQLEGQPHESGVQEGGKGRKRQQEHSEEGLIERSEYERMCRELHLMPLWRPQVSLLHQVGLRGAALAKLAESRPEIFIKRPSTIRRKLKFLTEVVGLSESELVKVVTKFPRILEYQIDRTLQPRLDYLRRCGVQEGELCKVVSKAPMLLELKTETLERRVAFLTGELCLREGELGKLLARHPQLLTCTEESMAARVAFLRETGLEQQQLGKAVLAHPQLLHYKIESMRERTAYLASVGMSPAQLAASVCRFPQLFSLSVESNLAPKWRYLVEHLGGDVATLVGYPAYLSLSLSSRIIPRHRFFQQCRPEVNKPFPMKQLKCADKCFAKFCGKTLGEYEAFKEQFEAEQAAQSDAAAAAAAAQQAQQQEQAQRQQAQQAAGPSGELAQRAQQPAQQLPSLPPRQQQQQAAPGRLPPPGSANGVAVAAPLTPAQLRRVSRTGATLPAVGPAASGGARQVGLPRLNGSGLGVRRLAAPGSAASLEGGGAGRGALVPYPLVLRPAGQAAEGAEGAAPAPSSVEGASNNGVPSQGLPLPGKAVPLQPL